jgi:hypothetical protein
LLHYGLKEDVTRWWEFLNYEKMKALSDEAYEKSIFKQVVSCYEEG